MWILRKGFLIRMQLKELQVEFGNANDATKELPEVPGLQPQTLLYQQKPPLSV